MEFNPLKITIGIVQSRDNEWVKAALKSASGQIYPIDYSIKVFDNREKKYSVGKAYNELTKMIKTDWVLFLGDDDYLMPDYMLSLAVRYFQAEIGDEQPLDRVVCITSYATLFDGERKAKQLNAKIVQGTWRVDYLKAHPFNEKMKKHVDVDLLKRTIENEEFFILLNSWNSGYYYRSHPGQISGEKFEKQDG